MDVFVDNELALILPALSTVKIPLTSNLYPEIGLVVPIPTFPDTLRLDKVPTFVIRDDWSAFTLNTWLDIDKPPPARLSFNCSPELFSIADGTANWTAEPETLLVVLSWFNLESAIEPANIALVTVPYCKLPAEFTRNTVLLAPFWSFARVVGPVA